MQITQVLETLPASETRLLLDQLYCERKLINFKRGESIPMWPDDIWIVSQGIVQLKTCFESGTGAVVGLLNPYMFFGLSLTILRPYKAIALDDALLLRLHKDELDKSPELTRSLLPQLKRRVQQTDALLAIASQQRIKDRLRELILLLQREFGQVTDDGIKLTVKLTHQQLAEMIGTSRVTVTRLMQDLRAEGMKNQLIKNAE